ncbi:MAG: ABC transporter permease [Pseudomonadales bacterium]|jgi:oligopeptide transport system permease protein|nr:ABC transporter permease [Pseudomonadales bacterium]
MNSATPGTFTAADFAPATRRPDVHGLSRPSQSYWEDAWRRLKTNARALASLWIVVGLLAFTVLGPLLWRVDPSAQNLDQVSRPPTLGASALLVQRGARWDVPVAADWPTGPTDAWLEDAARGELPAPEGLTVVGEPNTWSVRIRWEPVPNAARYEIYRNTYEPTALNELGLPLGETLTGNELGWEDALDLSEGDYWYSVTATDGLRESTRFVTVRAPVQLAVTIDAAKRSSYLDAAATPAPGDRVDLGAHPLGTDYLGRDMLARLMYGARTSLFIGILAPLLFILIGTAFGAFAGFVGGRTDALMMRFADFVVALPFLLFMILFRVASGIEAGESGIYAILIAMVVLLWPATARLVRGQILQIREEGYVQAARLLGAKDGYLILRHMIPNTLGVILVTLTFAIPSAIFTEAFLSFIGMGVAPPTPSWGSMCFEGLKSMLNSPHELFFPALFISITVLAFNLLGDGLRDALDARMRSKE